jgi:hypothetical protein
MLRRSFSVLLALVLAFPRAGVAGPEEDAARLGERLDALEARMPPERYDLTALAASLGAGVEPAFAFVRDRVGFDAYDGVLRGARGTLVHRAGNAPDRALLLAALLRQKGVATRFATSGLDAATTERLLARLFVRPPVAAAPTRPASELTQRVLGRGRRDADAILGALGPAVPSAAGPTQTEALRALSRHVWVQARAEDRWIDLDPSFPDAVPGRAPAPASGVHEDLPDDLFQMLTLRVAAEYLSGGALATEKCLEYTARVADLRDAHVYLIHAPSRPSGLADALSAGTAGPDAFAPALWVSGEAYGGRAVSFTEGAKAERGRPPGRGLGGVLGGGGALGSSRAFVAEWLELELRIPGRPPEVTRRALVDRAGAAWRARPERDPATLAPLARVDGQLCAPREVHNLWITAGRHDLGAFAQAIRTWGAPEAPGERGEPSFAETVWAFSLRTALLPIFSDEVILPALDASPAVRLYVDSPRVTIVTTGPAVREGVAGSWFRIDLRRDAVRVVAKSAEHEAEALAGRVRYGATQGALEHESCAGLARQLGLGEDRVFSTSGLLGADGVVRLDAAAGAGRFAHAGVLAEARAALAEPGVVLVAPKPALAKPFAAWWRVGADGTTAAVLGDGNAGGIFGNLPPGPAAPPVPLGRPATAPRPVVRPSPPRAPPVPSVPSPPNAPGSTRLWPPPSDVGPFDRLADPSSTDPKKRNRTAGQEYLMTLTWIAMTAAFAVGMGYLLAYMPGVNDMVLDLYGTLSEALASAGG